ncbi:MAG: zinc ABC transporter substrate-binding protein [Fusobacterium sp.]|nr:zinc ABC transporter substrate-binding protein [Fusobacterium sp.]
MKKILVALSMFFISSLVFAENIVITSIQPLYSLTSYIVKGTDIKVHSAFGSDTSMTMSRDAIREESFDISIAKKAQAVIDIAKIWHEDVIFSKARTNNINIIEIDASFPHDDKVSPLFFTDFSNGKTNYYVWLSNKNLVRMINIIAKDLVRIYPKNKNKIEKNVNEFTANLLEEENKVNEALLDVNSSEVISLSENLHYFLNDLNIFFEYAKAEDINAENVEKLIKQKDVKVIVSDRYLKKNVIKAIKDAGAEFVVINTLDIPIDLEEKMDADAILKNYRANTTALIEALSK